MEAETITIPDYSLPKTLIPFKDLSLKYSALLTSLDTHNIHDFTSLSLQKDGEHLSLPIVFYYIFNKYSLLPASPKDLEVLGNFIFKIEEGYNNCPYHNSCHAADVLWNLHHFITAGDVIAKLNLKPIDLFSIFVSAACHDYKHPGTNNAYLIKIGSDLATLYNDVSVLENMHVSQSLSLIRDAKFNILMRFNEEEKKHVKKRMISLILDSDNAKHGLLISAVNGWKGIDNAQLFESQQTILSLLFHLCDIGHVCKLFDITYEWAKRVYHEFYVQGNKEVEHRVSVTNQCEDKVNGKMQAGFIQSFFLGAFDALAAKLPSISMFKEQVMQNINAFSKQ